MKKFNEVYGTVSEKSVSLNDLHARGTQIIKELKALKEEFDKVDNEYGKLVRQQAETGLDNVLNVVNKLYSNEAKISVYTSGTIIVKLNKASKHFGSRDDLSIVRSAIKSEIEEEMNTIEAVEVEMLNNKQALITPTKQYIKAHAPSNIKPFPASSIHLVINKH